MIFCTQFVAKQLAAAFALVVVVVVVAVVLQAFYEQFIFTPDPKSPQQPLTYWPLTSGKNIDTETKNYKKTEQQQQQVTAADIENLLFKHKKCLTTR